MKIAYIFHAHNLSREALDNFNLLNDSGRECFVLFNGRVGSKEISEAFNTKNVLIYNDDQISERYSIRCRNNGFPNETITWYYCAHPLFLFKEELKDYELLFRIEYDLKSDNWDSFFNNINKSDADYIGLGFNSKNDGEEFPQIGSDWFHRPYTEMSYKKLIWSYFPILRISKRALLIVEEKILAGEDGHCEVLFPSIVYNEGLKIDSFYKLDDSGTKNITHKGIHQFDGKNL